MAAEALALHIEGLAEDGNEIPAPVPPMQSSHILTRPTLWRYSASNRSRHAPKLPFRVSRGRRTHGQRRLGGC